MIKETLKKIFGIGIRLYSVWEIPIRTAVQVTANDEGGFTKKTSGRICEKRLVSFHFTENGARKKIAKLNEPLSQDVRIKEIQDNGKTFIIETRYE